MQLYRLMTEVRAGAEQHHCTVSQRGIVTIWIRADSEASARTRAGEILARRRYQSHGELQLYLEETANASVRTTPAASETDEHDGSVRSGYREIKETALAQGDGLFEVWLP